MSELRTFSSPFFPEIELNRDLPYSVHIHSAYSGKIRTRKNSKFGHFSHSASFQFKQNGPEIFAKAFKKMKMCIQEKSLYEFPSQMLLNHLQSIEMFIYNFYRRYFTYNRHMSLDICFFKIYVF